MELLGLHFSIWIVVVVYLAAMLFLGWWCKRGIHDREGFLLGNRQFGVPMMVMHAFGAGTHPGDVAGVTSGTVRGGGSGIWLSWMWMFGTPFYWLIAPIVRRMRCLTMADYFEERFSRPASALYVIIATVGMTVATASILLATTRTVQGMMGKSGQEAWFFGILFISTAVFVLYSYWGGIVAAIKTDMVQGLMIIALSFIAIPAAIDLAGGWSAAKATLASKGESYLDLFDPKFFPGLTVLLLCISAPFSMFAQPHLMSVSAAGRTEWEGRVGFTYGNVLKRICTMGWCFLGLCWLAHLMNQGVVVDAKTADAAFGEAVRALLPHLLQGIMLACVMAAAMSSGDALQVTLAGLFSQNVYRPYVKPDATEEHYVQVTRYAGIVIIGMSLVFAILMRASVVKAILDYFNITATVGVAVVMGILWRRMNTPGFFVSALSAATTFVLARYVFGLSRAATTGYPLLAGLVGGIIGSLLSAPPRAETIERFFTKIYVPIGEEHKLELSLDEVVPQEARWCTWGGLFLVKPSTQSWVGFLVTLAICLALVGIMALLLVP